MKEGSGSPALPPWEERHFLWTGSAYIGWSENCSEVIENSCLVYILFNNVTKTFFCVHYVLILWVRVKQDPPVMRYLLSKRSSVARDGNFLKRRVKEGIIRWEENLLILNYRVYFWSLIHCTVIRQLFLFLSLASMHHRKSHLCFSLDKICFDFLWLQTGSLTQWSILHIAIPQKSHLNLLTVLDYSTCFYKTNWLGLVSLNSRFPGKRIWWATLGRQGQDVHKFNQL